jgi:ABC-type multidrug transport system ATPase subunit
VIEAKAISKRFGALQVLRAATFDVREGEVAALVGSNGSGKTTLIRCLLGVSSFEGTATIGGIDVARDGKTARGLVGYLPQSAVYPSDWTAREAITFVARLRRVDPSKALPLLERTGLGPHADRKQAVFSGGMRRRLGLALALVGEPPVLLMDEPTANLDAAGREDFLGLVRGIKDGRRTVLFCSHREDEVAEVADRVLALRDGAVTDGGRPRVLGDRHALIRPAHGRRADVLNTLARAGIEAKAVELGLALVELPSHDLERARAALDGTLDGASILRLEPAHDPEEARHGRG